MVGVSYGLFLNAWGFVCGFGFEGDGKEMGGVTHWIGEVECAAMRTTGPEEAD